MFGATLNTGPDPIRLARMVNEMESEVNQPAQHHDPIRLVRMVKQMMRPERGITRDHLLHHPDKLIGHDTTPNMLVFSGLHPCPGFAIRAKDRVLNSSK